MWILESLSPILELIIKLGLNKMIRLEPVKIIKCDIHLDTFPLRRYLVKTGK